MNRLLPAAGLLGLAAFVALAVTNYAFYADVIDLWSFHPEVTPFFDLDGPLAWIRAWRAGADVYLSAPAGAHGWQMNYSPLFLRLPLPWVGPASVPVYGLALDALFLLSLAVLPRARATADRIPLLLALFSPFCLFALERGNVDLLIFAMVALAVACLGHGLAVRLVGYATIVAAGLLKFYPWVLLLWLLRERFPVFLLAAVVATAIVVAFIVGYRDELALVVANLPVTIPFKDAFGASQLPNGIVLVTHPLRAPAGQWDEIDAALRTAAFAALYGAAVIGALRLGRSAPLQRAVARLAARESLCLFAGALLMSGCFFVGTSVGYRAIYMLFALPGMLALARVADDAGFARRVRWTVAVALVLLWSLPVQRLIAAAFGDFWIVGAGLTTERPAALIVGASFWLLREALWWWLMTFLLAAVVRTVLDSRVCTETLKLLIRSRA